MIAGYPTPCAASAAGAGAGAGALPSDNSRDASGPGDSRLDRGVP